MATDKQLRGTEAVKKGPKTVSRKQNWFTTKGKNLLLGAGFAAGAAVGLAACSDDTKTQADAGVQCAFVADDAGTNQCLPADKCESKVTTSDAGAAVPVCVPKPVSDAGASDAKQEDVSTTPSDAKAEDGGSGCDKGTKEAAVVKLGGKWEVGGVLCGKDGSASLLIDGKAVRLKTGSSSYVSCTPAVNGAASTVTLTCTDSTVFNVDASIGCDKVPSGGAAEVCSDDEKVQIVSWTTMNSTSSKSILSASSLLKAQPLLLKDDNATVTTSDLSLGMGPQVIGKLKSLGQANDGNVYVAGTVTGASSASVCGTPVGSSAVTVGSINLRTVATQNDVVEGAQFTADLQGYPDVKEAADVTVSGSAVTLQSVVAGNKSGVIVKDKTSGANCALTPGVSTSSACGMTWNGSSLTMVSAAMSDPCKAE